MSADDLKPVKLDRNGNIKTRAYTKVSYVVTTIALIVSICLSGFLVYRAWTMYQSILHTKTDNSPYSSKYQAKTFPGIEFMKSTLKDAPDGITEWNQTDDASLMKILPTNCKAVSGSQAMLAQRQASGNGYSVAIQVYGAGQARTQYENLKSSLTSCYPSAKSTNESVDYDKGYLMTYGDTIVSIMADGDTKTKLVDSIRQKTIDNLTSTGCVALTETVDDAKRSFYYDRNSFVGYMKTETVKQDVKLLDPSVPQILSAGKDDMSSVMSTIYKDPKAQAVAMPQSPLPNGMVTTLPTAPGIPSISSIPTKPATEKTITYQAADPDGPGCGWRWSGQVVPKFQEKTLEKSHSVLVSNAKTEIKNNAQQYNQQVIDWSRQTVLALSFTTKWDEYTSKTNAIYASWNDLNTKRDALKPQWYAYIEDLENWATWDQKRSNASNKWSNDIQNCVTSETQQNDQSTDGNTKSDAEIRSDCEQKTAKPAILSETKPNRPTKPTIPDNVTIPSGWPTEDNALNAKVEDDSSSTSSTPSSSPSPSKSPSNVRGDNSTSTNNNSNSNNGSGSSSSSSSSGSNVRTD